MDVRDLLAAVRHRLGLVVAFAVCGAVLLASVAVASRPTYTATATLAAVPIDEIATDSTSLTTFESDAAVAATSVPILTSAAAQLGVSVSLLQGQVSAALPTNGSDSIAIMAKTGSAQQSVRAANAVLAVMVADRNAVYGSGVAATGAARSSFSVSTGGLVGGLAGLILGAVAVILWELRHRRTRSAAGVSALLGGADVIPLPRSPLAAATQLRLLAVELDLELDRHPGAIIGVISPGPDHDLLAVAHQMALTMATPSRRVAVLVAGGEPDTAGMATVGLDGSLTGEDQYGPLIVGSAAAPESLTPQEARGLVDGLRRRADVVLVVAGDVVGRPASLRLMSSSVGAVLVVGKHRSEVADTHDTAAALATAGCPILATLLLPPVTPASRMRGAAKGRLSLPADVLPGSDRASGVFGAGSANPRSLGATALGERGWDSSEPDGGSLFEPAGLGEPGAPGELDRAAQQPPTAVVSRSYHPDVALAVAPEDFEFAGVVMPGEAPLPGEPT